MKALRVWAKDDFLDWLSDPEELEAHGWSPPDRRGVLFPENSAPVSDIREAAEMFAEWFHGRDGWERTWPVEMIVRDDRGDHYVVEVDREMQPEFTAGPPRAAQLEGALEEGCGDEGAGRER